jgi:membrane-associated protease RseP (regulator of RpoE activity)
MPPDDDVDEMWSQLYNGTAFTRVNSTAARMMPNATMMVPGSDGDGIVSIEVTIFIHRSGSIRTPQLTHLLSDVPCPTLRGKQGLHLSESGSLPERVVYRKGQLQAPYPFNVSFASLT